MFRLINKNETMISNATSRKESCIQIPEEFIVSFTDKDSFTPFPSFNKKKHHFHLSLHNLE